METSSLINRSRRPRIPPLGPVYSLAHPAKVNLIPVEILSEIFVIVGQTWQSYQVTLMLVCLHWYTVMLSTPGVHSALRIRRATQKEVIQTFLQARPRWIMDVIVDMNDAEDGSDFNADEFHACFMAAAQAASRWRSLSLISPPPHGDFKSLQILQPLKQLASFKLAQGFGMFADLLMTAISGTATPHFTKMELDDPVAVPFIVQPAWLDISHSLVTLEIRLPKRRDSPVDILPHLQRLETFVAHRLRLPVYPPDASLPLIHTLRDLDLKSVSVQWMAGHIFSALEYCSIIFPYHSGAIQALQPVTMTSCSHITYTSNDLRPLRHFHLPSLRAMHVKSGQWSVWRGNLQLVTVHHIVAARTQRLTNLHLDVQCSEQLLVCILRLLPALRCLWLGLASPHALSETFFRAFILEQPNSVGDSEVVGLPRKAIAPLCEWLNELYLHYKRWLRGPDKSSLLLAFDDIVESRDPYHQKRFNLRLSFEEAPMGQIWAIHVPYFHMGPALVFMIKFCGISSPYRTIPVTIYRPGRGPIPLPFKEVERLKLTNYGDDSPIEFIYTLDHMELMRYDSNQQRLPTLPPCNLPVFHALKVLVIVNVNPSFLAGHTFHKLQKCRVVTGYEPDYITGHRLFTEMPVCTRLYIDDLTLLSTFKLPRIRSLSVKFEGLKCNTIWKKQIAVNTNLSGLKLLHLRNWHVHGNLDQILSPLRSLKILALSFPPDMETFGSLLPLSANEASELKQSSSEGHSPVAFCPMLHSLKIEGTDPSKTPLLIPILQDIVILRALYGSPLKSFTFNSPYSQVELIGSDGSFTMGNSVLVMDPWRFQLDDYVTFRNVW
jgi:hypothetical protein